MRLLLDENISWWLVKYLAPHFDEVAHIDQTLLPSSPSDVEIWAFARANGWNILTKDWDFDFLASLETPPPKVILLHNAQLSVRSLSEKLLPKIEVIQDFLKKEEAALLELTL